MPDPVVIITFYSRCGSTEKLALAAAVGAIQARANIRLRRLRDPAAGGGIEQSPECSEAFNRMRKEYAVPSEADLLSADAIVVAVPARSGLAAAQWTEFLELLTRLGSEGKLEGKAGTAIAPVSAEDGPDKSVLMAISAAMLRAGMIALPPVFTVARAQALAQGRRIADIARALRPPD